jgi:low affinity Fe/Cu permease
VNEAKSSRWRTFFGAFAEKTSVVVGSPWAFLTACALLVLWAATGPLFGFSDTWQLVVNTGTTVVTFLVVFLIQNSQNRSSRAIQLKLDELLRGTDGPRTSMVDIEALSDEELDRLQEEFHRLHERVKREGIERDEENSDIGRTEV